MKKGISSKNKPQKSLLLSLKKNAGRNQKGRITIRHRGGGARKLYRMVDFGQRHLDQKGKVASVEYDPNRNGYIMLMEYADGQKAYVLAPHEIQVGDEILCAEKAEIKIGNRMKLKYVPVGEAVYNIELEPGRGGIMVRAAGTSAKVGAHAGKYTHLVFPSSEVRMILNECFASIGMVSHPGFSFERVKNAGATRLKGRRPKVRGSAMNPVDHPHGGGEGRSPIGMKFPKTPWGKPALGVKTRKRKQTTKFILERRKKKKRKK